MGILTENSFSFRKGVCSNDSFSLFHRSRIMLDRICLEILSSPTLSNMVPMNDMRTYRMLVQLFHAVAYSGRNTITSAEEKKKIVPTASGSATWV